MSVLAGLALLLTSVGIYGLIAQLATQRHREFGIRLALGATSAQMFKAAVRPGVVLAGAGAFIGFAGAYGLACCAACYGASVRLTR